MFAWCHHCKGLGFNRNRTKSGACFKIGPVNFQADVHQPNMVNILSKEHKVVPVLESGRYKWSAIDLTTSSHSHFSSTNTTSAITDCDKYTPYSQFVTWNKTSFLFKLFRCFGKLWSYEAYNWHDPQNPN